MTRNDSAEYRIVDEYQTPGGARFNWLVGNMTLNDASFDQAAAQAEFPYYWLRWQALGRSAADFNLLTCMIAAMEDCVWAHHAGPIGGTCQSRVKVIAPQGRYKMNYPSTIHFGGLRGHGSSEFYTNGSDYGGSFGQGGTSFWKDHARWLGSKSLRLRATTAAVAANPVATVSQVVLVTDGTYNTCYVGSRLKYPDGSTTARITAKGGSPGTRTVTVTGEVVNRGFPILTTSDILHSEEMNVFQSGTWGDPNLFGYNEAFQFSDFRIEGDTPLDDFDEAEADAGMAVWDMGSSAQINNVFTNGFADGFHFVRGTYVNCGQIVSFRHLRSAVFCQGGGQFRFTAVESDECPAVFRIEGGYDRPGSASFHCDWLKVETGPAPSRPVGKGTMVMDGHGWINASFDHVQYASVNQMPHCMFRINSDLDNNNAANDNTCSVKVNSLALFGPCYNLFHDVRSRRLWRMHAPGGQSNKNGYWRTLVKSFEWISDTQGGGGGKLISPFFQPVVVPNVHPGRRQPLNIDPMTGNMIGTWDETLGTPAYTFVSQAGPISNPPPTPTEVPYAANALVTMSDPTIDIGDTSQATVAVFDQFGNAFPSTDGTWSIQFGPGTITVGGLMTATGSGAVVVNFNLGGNTWFAQVNVNAGTPPIQVPETVIVTIPLPSVVVGQQMQAQYQVLDEDGIPMTATGLWTVTAGSATINSTTGVVIPTGPGSVTVRCQVGGPSGPFGTGSFTATAAPPVLVPNTVTVTVPQSSLTVGQQMQAVVVVQDQLGGVLSSVPGTWAVVSGPATITQSGLVTATAAGSVTISFTAIGGINPSGTQSFATVAAPPAPVPTTVTVTLPQSTLQSGQTMQASRTVFDQFLQPITATGVWSIVSGPATINTNGMITALGQGVVTVRFAVTGGTPFGQSTFTATVVVPPQTLPLFAITFAGQNPLALPGCVPIPAGNLWKAGQIAGAKYSTFFTPSNTSVNTNQRLTTPVAGVKRIVLKNAQIKEAVDYRWLNSDIRTRKTRRFYQANTAETDLGAFIPNAPVADITIVFPTPQTIETVFGGIDPNNPHCLHLELERIEMWAQ